MTETYENSPIDRIFGVVLEKQTYKNMGYLLLSFPLGSLYFAILVPGISLSFSLMILVVGFPLLLGVLLLSDHLLRFERFLLRTILNEPVHLERRRPLTPERRIFVRLGERLAQGHTWRGLLYLLLRFAMGLVSFVLVVVLTPVSLLLISLPLTYRFIPVHMFDRTVTNFDQALICCSTGAILALVSTHLFNGWTALWKRVATALLS